MLGALEDLHEHARMVVVVLQQATRLDEVRVRVVAVAHPLEGQAKTLGDRRVRGSVVATLGGISRAR